MTTPTVTRRAARWMRRVAPRLALVVALPSVAACQLGHRHPLSAEEQARWSRDSAQYVQDSLKWVRDAVVRDSISRSVNTDSLYHLYHQMLVAPDPVPIMLLVNCESGRVTWLYGTPGITAMQRMDDTVWRPNERAAANRMWDKIRNMSVAQMGTQGVSPSKCGWRKYPKMPEVYNGTDLETVAPRPRPPKRP